MQSTRHGYVTNWLHWLGNALTPAGEISSTIRYAMLLTAFYASLYTNLLLVLALVLLVGTFENHKGVLHRIYKKIYTLVLLVCLSLTLANFTYGILFKVNAPVAVAAK